MSAREAPGLAAAICSVMTAVRYVKQTGRNEFHRYRYASDEDLLAALQPAMAEAGLALLPIRVESTTVEHSPDRKGKTQWRTDVCITYRLMHVSGESIELQAAGSGIDGEDKGVYKAKTGALKYVLRHTFLVPTGDDAERAQGESSQQTQQPPQGLQQRTPPSEAASFREAVKAQGWSYQEACDAIASVSSKGLRPLEMDVKARRKAFVWLKTTAGQEAMIQAGEKRGRALEAYTSIPEGERRALAEAAGIKHRPPSAHHTSDLWTLIEAHSDLAQGGAS